MDLTCRDGNVGKKEQAALYKNAMDARKPELVFLEGILHQFDDIPPPATHPNSRFNKTLIAFRRHLIPLLAFIYATHRLPTRKIHSDLCAIQDNVNKRMAKYFLTKALGCGLPGRPSDFQKLTAIATPYLREDIHKWWKNQVTKLKKEPWSEYKEGPKGHYKPIHDIVSRLHCKYNGVLTPVPTLSPHLPEPASSPLPNHSMGL